MPIKLDSLQEKCKNKDLIFILYSNYLQVVDDVTFSELGKFCGNTVNETIVTTSGHRASVRFTSDNVTRGKGFKIDYKLGIVIAG